MKRMCAWWGIGVLLLLALPPADAATWERRPAAGHHDGRQRTDRFIVVPKEGVDPAEFNRWLADRGLTARSRAPWERTARVVQPPEGGDLQAAIETCSRSDLVDFVEPDYLIRPALVPDDPQFTDGTAWALDNTGTSGGVANADIGATEAWDLVTDASEVVVAVVDSGVRTTHEDLSANLWQNPGEIPGNGIDDDHDGIVDDVVGFDAVNGTGDPTDQAGHGTHVAGIIGAVGNNGKGTAGIAWKVRIMALRFLDDVQGGSTSDAITCIDYAVAHGARVINASWGTSQRSRSLQRAIQRARAAGVILVAAAGNDGVNLDVTPTYPGAFPEDNLVCVTGTTRGDAKYAEGNYGSVGVDLGAPAVGIYSSWSTADDAYAYATGTSMATPMVTGSIALLIARHPEAGYQAIIEALLQSVDPLPALAGKTVTGGRLNVAKALRYLDRRLAVAPTLSLSRPAGGVALLQIAGSPSLSYTVESAEDLQAWTTVASGTADASGSLEVDVRVEDAAPRFFRVRLAE